MVEAAENWGRDDSSDPLRRTGAFGWFERERPVWPRVVVVDDVLPQDVA